MMKSIIKNFTNSVICLSFLAIVLGIVLMLYPGMSLTALSYVFAAYLVVQGVALIILDIKAWRLYIPFEGMLKGILSVFFGVLLVKNPGAFAIYIGIALGVWIVAFAFSGIKTAFALRYTGAPWLLMILINVFDILFGFVILYSPVRSALSLTMTLGVVLVVHAIVNIFYMFAMKKNAKDVEKLVMEKLDMIDAEVASAVEAANAAETEAEGADETTED